MRYLCKKCHEGGQWGVVCIADKMSKNLYYGFNMLYIIPNQICRHDPKSTKNTAEWKELKE